MSGLPKQVRLGDRVGDATSVGTNARVASVVANDLDFGMGRMFEICYEEKLPTGFLCIFRGYSAALAWCSEDPSAPSQ